MNGSKTQELARHALGQLVNELEAGHSEQLKAYLAAMGRFRAYSPTNVLLICMQFPQASRVAGYRTWQRLGRQVRRGAKAIRILAPILRRARSEDKEHTERVVAFKAACVFDVSQTDGDPLPEFSRVNGDPGLHRERLKDLIVARGIALDYSDTIGGADGLSTRGRIVIRSGLEPAEEFSVLAHELAHVLMHHEDGTTPESKQVRETEAEAVAFIVCQTVGLDTNSAASDYIQLYEGDRDTLLASLERIQRTATTIVDGILAEEGEAFEPLHRDAKRPAA